MNNNTNFAPPGAADPKTFHWVDWVVFGSTIVISLCIGAYHGLVGGGQKTTNQFLMANRKLGLIPVALSMTVTFMSGLTILGNSAEAYYHGVTYWFYLIGLFAAACLGALLFVPLLYPLKLTSVNEYLYLRYESRLVVLLGMFCQVMSQIAINGISIFGVSLVLKTMTEIDTYVSTIVTGLIATVYCTWGGFKAVIWTDVFQAIVILGGIVVIVIQGTLEVGSPKKVWDLYEDGGRTDIETSMDPFVRLSLFSLTVCYGIQWSILFGVNQNAVQRFSTLKNLKTARMSVFGMIPGQFLIGTLAVLAGVVIYAYYADLGCDPKANFKIFSPNQITPYFVMNVLDYKGVPGIFAACLFACTLSTISSTISANVTLVWQDIFVGFGFADKYSERTKTIGTRLLTVLFGGISILVGYLVEHIGGTFIQVTTLLASGFSVPFAALIYFGATTPRMNWASALVSSISGMIFTLWVSMGQIDLNPPIETLHLVTTNCTWPPGFPPARNFSGPPMNTVKEYTGLDKLYTISPWWITLIGLGLAAFFGFLSSLLPGFHSTTRVPNKYLFTFVRCCREEDEEKEERVQEDVDMPEKI